MTTRDVPVGANVFWSPQVCDRERLRQELAAIGLENYTPCQRTEAAALKMALEEYVDDMLADRRARKDGNGEAMKRDKIVQPLLSQKEDGFEVVDVTRRQRGNAYICDFRAKIVDGQVEISYGYASQSKIQAAYEVYRATLGGTAVGGALVDIVMKELHGVSLKDNGGIYWLPPGQCDRWEHEVIPAFESVGDTKVYINRTVMDGQCVRAVADNISAEIVKASAELEQEIKTNQLGELAIANRLQKAKALHSRVEEYESILSRTLGHLHDSIKVAELAALSAMIQQDDQLIGDVFEYATV